MKVVVLKGKGVSIITNKIPAGKTEMVPVKILIYFGISCWWLHKQIMF